MNEKIFETVLNEILNELQESNRQLKELLAAGAALEARVSEFERRVGEMTVLAPPADVGAVKEVVQGGVLSVQQQVADGLQRIHGTVERMPKVKGWQIALLPRLGGDDFAYLVKKLAHTAMVVMVAGTMFLFGMKWLDKAYMSGSTVGGVVERAASPVVPVAPVAVPPGGEKKRKWRTKGRENALDKKYISIISDSLADSAR